MTATRAKLPYLGRESSSNRTPTHGRTDGLLREETVYARLGWARLRRDIRASCLAFVAGMCAILDGWMDGCQGEAATTTANAPRAGNGAGIYSDKAREGGQTHRQTHTRREREHTFADGHTICDTSHAHLRGSDESAHCHCRRPDMCHSGGVDRPPTTGKGDASWLPAARIAAGSAATSSIVALSALLAYSALLARWKELEGLPGCGKLPGTPSESATSSEGVLCLWKKRPQLFSFCYH